MMVVFDPNGIRLGEYGIPKVVTTDAYPVTQDERLVMVSAPNLAR